MDAAVAHREVELAVRAEPEAVEVVADEPEADGESGVEKFSVAFLEHPEVGDRGEPHVSLPREDSRGEPVGGRVEPLGEGRRVIDPAAAAPVLKQPDALARGQRLVTLPHVFPVHRLAVGDGATGEVVVDPAHAAADVEGAGAESMGLDDEDSALLVEREGDGIDEIGLGGVEVELKPLGRTKAFRRLLGLGVGLLLLSVCDGRENQGADQRGSPHPDLIRSYRGISRPSAERRATSARRSSLS